MLKEIRFNALPTLSPPPNLEFGRSLSILDPTLNFHSPLSETEATLQDINQLTWLTQFNQRRVNIVTIALPANNESHR